jgi:hypothetical protein
MSTSYGKNEFKISEIDSDKAKKFFVMLGEVVAMIVSLFKVFDSKNDKKTDNTNSNN